MDVISILKELYELRLKNPSVSGREYMFANKLIEWLMNHHLNTTIDTIGNIIISPQKNVKPSYLLDAHLDEVGCVITGCDENDKYRFTGALCIEDLISQPIIIATNSGLSLTGNCSQNKTDELLLPNDVSNLFLVSDEPLSPGDVFSFSTNLVINDNIITGRALDNLAGISVLISLILSPGSDFFNNCLIVFSVQEEIGYRGLPVLLTNHPVNFVISVDAIASSTESKYPIPRLGKGAVICIGPGEFSMGRRACESLNGMNIQYQQLHSYYPNPTNSAVACSMGIAKTLALGYPLLNKHRYEEKINLSDLLDLKNAILCIIKSAIGD